MTDQPTPPPDPKTNLEELKKRYAQSQEVVIDASGRLINPDEQGPGAHAAKKTVLKPQRWFTPHERPWPLTRLWPTRWHDYVPWYTANPARLVLEKRTMQHRFPQFDLRFDQQRRQLVWYGALTTNRGNRYTIAVYYPDEFPARPPQVFPIDPPITAWKNQATGELMHQFNDGSLCLHHPYDRTFEPNTTAATFVAISAAWLFAYENWRQTGLWVGEEAPHPDYYL